VSAEINQYQQLHRFDFQKCIIDDFKVSNRSGEYAQYLFQNLDKMDDIERKKFFYPNWIHRKTNQLLSGKATNAL